MVDFSGFELPIWYKGIVPECKAVRNSVGIFDVSHMGRNLISGKDAAPFLDYVTTNDVSVLEVGRGHYSVMCNEKGGIVDDIIICRLTEKQYLMVFNAGNREKDLAWLNAKAERFRVEIQHVSDAVSMFAVQGPNAEKILQEMCDEDLSQISRFGGKYVRVDGNKGAVTRTGYTGEDGFEVFTWDAPIEQPAKAVAVWNAILDHGKAYDIQACGLGARDVLRLEAGMCLYGNDIDESTTPLQARVSFVVKLTKQDFIGRDVLAKEKAEGAKRVRVGLKVLEAGIPRAGCDILKESQVVGRVTSGTFSPTINQGIAVGYVPKEYAKTGESLAIRVRNKDLRATVAGFPFYDSSKYGWQRTKA
jgi:aminomethyltransferase